MLHHINIENVLFLDIETVPRWPDYQSTPEHFRKLWDLKAKYLCKENETPETIFQRAGIYAEFGKIICVSVAFTKRVEEGYTVRVKSFCDDDEKVLLTGFLDLLNKFTGKAEQLLCAHNGKEFDFPFLARRILVNGLKMPSLLNIGSKKPWEVPHIDTMEMWKFGDYKNFTSLNLLAALFDIPTPKDDIDGSEVYRVYWHEKDLARIMNYCQKDVITIVRLFLRYKGEKLIEDEHISYV